MEDFVSLDPQGPDAVAPDTGVQQSETAPAAQPEQASADSGGNPAWNSLRQKLDPMLFKSIEPDLKDWDREAQKRIESVNQQYAPFKALVDQGATPQVIQQSVLIAREIDADPVGFHNKLTNFLQQTGRMPQTAAEVKQVADGEDPADIEQQAQAEDPRIQQLVQQNQQILQAFSAQQEQQLRVQADAELTAETTSLKQAHPELSDDDVREVIKRAAATTLMNQQQGVRKVTSLEEAYQEVAAYRTRILSAPRAGDSAPRLLPTSGAVPSTDGQRKSLGQLSKDETIDLLAGLVSKGRNS